MLYPRLIGIELVRGCNFSCRMCPVTAHRTNEEQRLRYMDLSLLERICKEIDRLPSVELWLFGFGESLLHPRFRECLEIVHQSEVARNSPVLMHTNASLLQGEKAQALLDVPVVKKLVFSFDGFGDAESYEMLRGPHYHRVLANIREFAKLARKRRPDLVLATCTILPKEGEVPGLRTVPRDEATKRLERIFRPMGVNVEVRDMHDYCGRDKLEVAGTSRQDVYGGCGFVERDSLNLTVTGKAQPCCAVYDEEFNVGSIQEQGILELFNNERMKNVRHLLRLDKRREIYHCEKCSLSLGGHLGREALRQFWIERDDQGAIDDLTERRYIFGEVVAEHHRVIKVDLGCGKKKQPGFIGIDRFPLPGVDVVADINRGLPLADDSVDYLLASHSLEHVDDLPFTMREIYRVCKHKALVCIVAPYFHTSLNIANPFHKQAFNEHTPRFFTTSNWTAVKQVDYRSPCIPEWGLAESDCSRCDIDFRCLRMELFYFPEYRHLGEDERRSLRQKWLNVADTIMYHLLVVKEPMSDEEVSRLAGIIRYQEPLFYTLRRAQEERELLALGHARLGAKNLVQWLGNNAREYIRTHGVRSFLRRAPVYAFSLLRRKMTSCMSSG